MMVSRVENSEISILLGTRLFALTLSHIYQSRELRRGCSAPVRLLLTSTRRLDFHDADSDPKSGENVPLFAW